MSSFSDATPNTVDASAAAEQHDYASVLRRSREEPRDTIVSSLTTLAGLCMAKESYDFFEELQVDLSSIEIEGDDFDKLWCMLDWQRYILGLWMQQIEKGRRVPERRWVEIKESWEVIIKTTVSLNLKYASTSREHQRPTSTDGPQTLAFGKIFYRVHDDDLLYNSDMALICAVVQATDKKAWNTPLFHEKAFTGLIESAMDDLATTHSSVDFQGQGPFIIESCEFQDFINVLDKQVKKLIALSPLDEQEAISTALDRALITALLGTYVDGYMRCLPFFHSLFSAWPFNNDILAVGIETVFQELVQERFGKIITHPYDSSSPESFPFKLKDLEDILALGADVRGEINGHRDCSLWIAATSNNSQFFKALVYAGAPYTMENELDRSPLQAAAKAGNLDIVTFLLNREQNHLQVSVNHEGRTGKTALHEAAKRCDEGIIKVLLQQPEIDPNTLDSLELTPIITAVYADVEASKKYASMKAFLRSKSVDLNAKTPFHSINALHVAASQRDATLKILVRYVKGINDQNCGGMIPLHFAVEENSKPNVDILLSHGADPTIPDDLGYTPLLLAFKKYCLGPMELLLSLPGSLKYQCPEPIGGFKDHNPQRIKDHGSPVSLVLRDYGSARKRKRAHIVLALRIILGAKPDLEMRNEFGQSVLNNVIRAVDDRALLELLQAGADVNSQDNDGRTPLHRLMRVNYFTNAVADKVELLLIWGAEIGIKDKDGQAAVTVEMAQQRLTSRRHKRILELITEQAEKQAKAQRQKDREMLAKKKAAYDRRQKQSEAKGKKSHASSNPFAVLLVETEETERDPEVESMTDANS